MLCSLENGGFECLLSDKFDKGPDQYAGQLFADADGNPLLMTWIPGWKYTGFAQGIDVGCLSVPRSIVIENNRICGRPSKAVAHLLKDSDPLVTITEEGFTVNRQQRPPLIHKGIIGDIKILRDEYIMEIFVNGGETVYSLLLC
jgi:sucrose-6-phosphate hydrolase SacC (GH32 family)